MQHYCVWLSSLWPCLPRFKASFPGCGCCFRGPLSLTVDVVFAGPFCRLRIQHPHVASAEPHAEPHAALVICAEGKHANVHLPCCSRDPERRFGCARLCLRCRHRLHGGLHGRHARKWYPGGLGTPFPSACAPMLRPTSALA